MSSSQQKKIVEIRLLDGEIIAKNDFFTSDQSRLRRITDRSVRNTTTNLYINIQVQTDFPTKKSKERTLLNVLEVKKISDDDGFEFKDAEEKNDEMDDEFNYLVGWVKIKDRSIIYLYISCGFYNL